MKISGIFALGGGYGYGDHHKGGWGWGGYGGWGGWGGYGWGKYHYGYYRRHCYYSSGLLGLDILGGGKHCC